MKENKHNLHCTCHDCSGTGMSMVDQRKRWDGNGSRLIRAADRDIDRQNIARAETARLLTRAFNVAENS